MKQIVLKSIQFYQRFISASFGQICRFYPSCSEYSYKAIKKHGLAKGLFLSLKRLLKCHSWHPGGIDLP